MRKDWLQHLRHLLLAYLEDNRREAADTDEGWEANVRRIYVSRYRHRRHGRRDDRPQQWRKYLQPRPPSE